MTSFSRKERRRVLNKLNVKNETTYKDLFQRIGRSHEMGKLIHKKNTQDVYDSLKEQEVEKETEILKKLIEIGFTEKDAWDFINNNKKIKK